MKSNDQQLLEEAYEGIFGKVQFITAVISAFATQDLQKLKEIANNVQSNEMLKLAAIKTAKGVMEKPGTSMDLKLMATKFLAFLMSDESQKAVQPEE